MYSIVTINDTVRIPPKSFAENLDEALKKMVREQYEGLVDEDLGVVISVVNAQKTSEGKVVPGDGAAYFDSDMQLLVYKPAVSELVEGVVSESTEFGAFVKVGPIEGLIHVSQIMDDYIVYDAKTSSFVGKESNAKLAVGDHVTARIVTVSLRGTIPESKIGLTMRQPGLGKAEWQGIEFKKRDKSAPKEGKEKREVGEHKEPRGAKK